MRIAYTRIAFCTIFRITATSGLPSWACVGMHCLPSPICHSIVVAFNLRQPHSVAGTCQQKSAAEIYATFTDEI